MCGICGELRIGPGPRVTAEHVLAMREALIHRGPDDQGLFVAPDGQVGLGFRRLRIVDLTPSANQPMPNEDGSVQVVFNGEIYNFRELRKTLVSHGHQFRSQSDTEVIAHLYEEEGADCIAELDGMFGLAIWDSRTRQLLLARDRAGKKPLFYYRDGARFAFASEIKAFFQHPDIPIEADPLTFPSYFIHGYVPSPATFYRGVVQVEPGSLLTIKENGTTAGRTYWRLRYPTEMERARSTPPPRAQAVSRVRELLHQAVERRLISDVPLGAFLSGGLDSTIVVGLMSRLMSEPVKTFSIGFKGDPAYDETRYSRLVAKRFGTEHTEFRVAPSAIDLVDRLVWHHDGPFGDASAVPTYIVSELTRKHVTVVLNGDGGDEVFAGYVRFCAGVAAERIPKPLRSVIEHALGALPASPNERNLISKAKRFARAMNLPIYERMTRWSGLFYDDLDQLLNPDLLRSAGPIDKLGYLQADLPFMEGLSTLGKILHVNFRSYLLDDLLVKVDRCTMANAIEARSPFLDRDLIEYVATLPDDMKLNGRYTKLILREAFADLVPDEIIQRGKMGFGVPLGTWFRGELREYLNDLLLASDARYPQYLSRPRVEALVKQHQSGHGSFGLQLWTLLTFETWLRLLPGWTRKQPAMLAAVQ